MPYCRDCATEYDALLPWCPNCGTLCDDETDEWEVALMDEAELVVVFEAEDEIQALLNRTMLEEADVQVMERLMEAEWFEGVKQRGLHSQLLVREQDAEMARQLLAALRQDSDSGELADDLPPDEPDEFSQDDDE